MERVALALLPAAVFALLPGAGVGQPPDGGPVSLHPGAVYAWLTQASFEPVTSVAGQGAFTRVPAPDHTLEPAVLVSHRMARGGEVDVHGTLGTGLADPGEILLLGVSIGLRRVFLTAGAATRLVEEGRDPLLP